jgi:hypothetical protein
MPGDSPFSQFFKKYFTKKISNPNFSPTKFFSQTKSPQPHYNLTLKKNMTDHFISVLKAHYTPSKNPPTPGLSLYTHNDKPDLKITKKVLNQAEFALDPTSNRILLTRMKACKPDLIFPLLHSETLPTSSFNFCSPDQNITDLYFESGRFTLKNLLEVYKQKGAHFQYSFLCELLSFLIGVGGFLEDNLEWIPEMKLENIL